LVGVWIIVNELITAWVPHIVVGVVTAGNALMTDPAGLPAGPPRPVPETRLSAVVSDAGAELLRARAAHRLPGSKELGQRFFAVLEVFLPAVFFVAVFFVPDSLALVFLAARAVTFFLVACAFAFTVPLTS
jgi:hypothetical protein